MDAPTIPIPTWWVGTREHWEELQARKRKQLATLKRIDPSHPFVRVSNKERT